jgi:hypothetical protein
MEFHDIDSCPHCQSKLETGYLAYTSGLFWSSHKLNWWQSIFIFAFPYGKYVVGNLGATPWFRSRAAHRCVGCRVLVIPTYR